MKPQPTRPSFLGLVGSRIQIRCTVSSSAERHLHDLLLDQCAANAPSRIHPTLHVSLLSDLSSPSAKKSSPGTTQLSLLSHCVQHTDTLLLAFANVHSQPRVSRWSCPFRVSFGGQNTHFLLDLCMEECHRYNPQPGTTAMTTRRTQQNETHLQGWCGRKHVFTFACTSDLVHHQSRPNQTQFFFCDSSQPLFQNLLPRASSSPTLDSNMRCDFCLTSNSQLCSVQFQPNV